MSATPEIPGCKSPDQAAELASNARWIRTLARSLVADASLADDLVQDTWVAVLRRGPASGLLSRAWLATVLRRRLSETRRECASRDARERGAARREALPSTVEMVERAAAQRDLVQAVLELDEPYRTTILWRFFEELPPRRIARRANVPVATVNSRIARGLEKLRARLADRHGAERDRRGAERDGSGSDRDGRQANRDGGVGERYDRSGDREAWVQALLPLLRGSGQGPAWIGALLLKTSTQLALAAAGTAAVVAALVLWSRNSPETAGTPSKSSVLAGAAKVDEPRDAKEPATPSIDAVPASSTADRTTAAAPPAPTKTVPPLLRLLRGEVLDASGGRLAGIALRLAGASADALRSGTDGRFEIRVPPSADSVLSADPRWSTVLAGSARVAPETLSIVVVAARLDLAGIVVDEDGTPQRGAELAVHVPRGFGASFGRPLDASLERRWNAVTDAAGRFALADVPAIRDASLQVGLGGFATAWLPLPTAADEAMRIVLVRPRASAGRLGGIVVDPNGGLVPGARVSVGWESTFSDASGRFELDVAKTPVPMRVTATKEGFLPAVQEAEKKEDGSPAWPAEVLLRLGGVPRTIAGRVLDGEGAPIAGARVWLDDPTYFGLVEREPVQVETLLSRKDAPFWAFVTTQGDGSFEVGGLLERTYRLHALDPETLLAATSPPIDAGTRGLEIRLPKDALREKVAGRVVARDGSPVAGASVVVQRFAMSVEFPGGGTRDEWAPRPEVKTDAEGRFEIRNVPKEGVEIFVHGEAILFWSMDLKAETGTDDLRIVVSRRMHLQIELDEPIDRADEVRVLDGEGQPMILRIMRGETSFTNRKADVVQGRSQVLSTAEDARTVVFLKAGAEIGRVPIVLRAGEVMTVRY